MMKKHPVKKRMDQREDERREESKREEAQRREENKRESDAREERSHKFMKDIMTQVIDSKKEAIDKIEEIIKPVIKSSVDEAIKHYKQETENQDKYKQVSKSEQHNLSTDSGVSEHRLEPIKVLVDSNENVKTERLTNHKLDQSYVLDDAKMSRVGRRIKTTPKREFATRLGPRESSDEDDNESSYVENKIKVEIDSSDSNDEDSDSESASAESDVCFEAFHPKLSLNESDSDSDDEQLTRTLGSFKISQRPGILP